MAGLRAKTGLFVQSIVPWRLEDDRRIYSGECAGETVHTTSSERVHRLCGHGIKGQYDEE